MKNIVLTGFMGSGKSYFARRIGGITGIAVVDTDAEIQRREGKNIADIFAGSGEEYFRGLESRVLLEESLAGGRILSTGGGALLRPDNAEILKRYGTVFFLDTPFDICYNRIKSDSRRPIAAAKTREELLELYNYRRGIYIERADFVLDGSLPAHEITKTVLKKMTHG